MSEVCWRLGCGRSPVGELVGVNYTVDVCRQHGERWVEYPRWTEFSRYDRTE